MTVYLYQDGTFSFEDFSTTFDEYDVQRVMRSYENSISIHVHCCEEGEWKQVQYKGYNMAHLRQTKYFTVAMPLTSKAGFPMLI